MPCDSYVQPQQTPQQRRDQVKDAIDRLEKAIGAGSVTVRVGAQGAVAFAGWTGKDRVGVTDACAYRKLLSAGAPAFRRALARAEALAGRQVNERAVGAGVHSHDGGGTWHPGHK